MCPWSVSLSAMRTPPQHQTRLLGNSWRSAGVGAGTLPQTNEQGHTLHPAQCLHIHMVAFNIRYYL